MQSFYNGLTVWALNVLPALLPFSIITAFMLNSQPRRSKLCLILFGNEYCSHVILTSLICGYPIGAKTISDKFANGEIDSQTTSNLSLFCSTASPVFVIGTVGKLLGNVRSAVIILISHLFGAYFNYLMYCNKSSKQAVLKPLKTNDVSLSSVISNSITSVTSVGGLIALFYMICEMISGILPNQDSTAMSFLFGLLEMTNGILKLSKTANTFTATVLSCSLISFGGICIALQNMSYLSLCKIKWKKYLLAKCTQSAISTIICYALCCVIM